MTRLIISIFLAWILSLNLSMQAGLVINYLLNKESITQLFCVNTDKPQMKCNGQCHLKEQLQKVETPTSNDEPKSAQWSFPKLSEFVVAPMELLTLPITIKSPQKTTLLFNLGIPTDISLKLLKPPRC